MLMQRLVKVLRISDYWVLSPIWDIYTNPPQGLTSTVKKGAGNSKNQRTGRNAVKYSTQSIVPLGTVDD